MDVYEGYLYVGLSPVTVGDGTLAELWRTNNGCADYFDKGDALFGQALYIGTQNTVDGGEIWRTLNVVYLPVVFSAY